ncbi:hypothetical protein ABI_08550 [Asticcacaulis biprosthecium C19]|uniref:Uncharacterized protein n=1 Tax=Asticcacaulis biprosthecium C19 TaxID=715226 RepID=F4QG91_9CAUL|nr:hypothetical protein ABI_08550 [Asticcacaulis biprosthecium C19]
MTRLLMADDDFPVPETELFESQPVQLLDVEQARKGGRDIG